jgi:signal transduction histidine kinase
MVMPSEFLWGLLAFAAIALAAGTVRWWLRSLRHREEELEAKVRERTEDLALRNRALERLHHQLQRSLEGRIQLTNTVIHDLRSPLNSILISVERLQGEGGVDREAALALIDRESRRLEQILAKLLDQSRSEGLAESLHLRLCRPTEILQGLADTFRLRAEARDLSADLELDPSAAQVWILADTTALQQVLFNLIENALKFTQPPGIVGIRSRVEPEAFCLEVWDTGRGIESGKLETIFQPYRQALEGDSTSGWGLGLSICAAMVKAHQGRIELESELGRGTTFRVVIPLVMPKVGTR